MIWIRFVARHLIAKADHRAAEGVANNYLESCCISYVCCVCCILSSVRCVRCVKWKLHFLARSVLETRCYTPLRHVVYTWTSAATPRDLVTSQRVFDARPRRHLATCGRDTGSPISGDTARAEKLRPGPALSLIHIWRCRRIERCRSRWSPYH